jgi:RNA polymerase sigma factor for flagellar operon FliA
MTADVELWRAYRRTKNPQVRDRLIEKYLPVVKHAAAWMAGRLPSHLRLDDLYSAGMLGFLDAVEDYDPERGVEFAVYAAPRIRGAIFDDLRRLDCVPRRVRRKAREAQRAIEALTQRLDRAPTEEEIAGELKVDVEDYRRLLTEGVTLLSLDATPHQRDEANTPLDTLEDTVEPSPLSAVEVRELRTVLTGIIDGLPERERQVLALYYYEELTMQEVGKVLGVTESRVSQIHSGAILRVRAALRRHRLRPRDVGVGAAADHAPGPRRSAR